MRSSIGGWVLNSFGEKATNAVWIGSGLVTGYGKFVRPLERLKQCGDTATRLLLHFYGKNDMEQFGGVPPAPNVYEEYMMEHVDQLMKHADQQTSVLAKLAEGLKPDQKLEIEQELASIEQKLASIDSDSASSPEHTGLTHEQMRQILPTMEDIYDDIDEWVGEPI